MIMMLLLLLLLILSLLLLLINILMLLLLLLLLKESKTTELYFQINKERLIFSFTIVMGGVNDVVTAAQIHIAKIVTKG